jgi:ABC-2 type transport system permease protein
MLLFASVVAPLLITRARVEASCFLICDDDDTDVTRDFIDYVANSKAFKGLVYISKVETIAEGQRLIDDGQVSGMLYIPRDFYKEFSEGKNVTVDVYGNTFHTMETVLVIVAVEAALNTVGRSQNALNVIRDYAVSQVGSSGDVDVLYDELLDLGIKVVTNRKAVIGQEGFISPAGELLPAELYLSAMLAWFLSLATLPLSSFSAGDFSASVLQRGLRARGMRSRFLTARLLSGAVFLLLVTLLIFPIGLGASSLDRMFRGNTAAFFAAVMLLALSFSAISLGLSALLKSSDAAVWVGFWLIVLFAMAGGAILPDSMLPDWAKAIGQWSPVRSAMRLLAGTVFKFDAGVYWWDMLKAGLWGVVGALCAGAGFMRRSAA